MRATAGRRRGGRDADGRGRRGLTPATTGPPVTLRCMGVGLLFATWVDWAQACGTAFAALAAVLVPLTAFVRRPSLALTEQEARRHSRVEQDRYGNTYPHVRLFVQN